MKNIIVFINKSIIISIITLFFFLFIDIAITNILNIRGFSKFYESHNPTGYINKKDFEGYYGGFLHEFYSYVTIGQNNNRNSSICEKIDINTLIIGDSITAGFEVDDDQTFVSLINKNCNNNNLNVINGGVRGHDTNQVISNYLRIIKNYNFKKVLYLISFNDFHENLIDYHYFNMVKKFGRAKVNDYENISFFKPKISNYENKYQKVRIFISDNFYILSRLIAIIENYSNINNKTSHINYTYNVDETKIRLKHFEKLLKIFKKYTLENNSILYLGIVPCTLEIKNLCKNIDEYEKKINLISKKNGLVIIPFVKIFKKYNNLNEDKFFFKNDGHLNNYGHEIFSKIIEDYLN